MAINPRQAKEHINMLQKRRIPVISDSETVMLAISTRGAAPEKSQICRMIQEMLAISTPIHIICPQKSRNRNRNAQIISAKVEKNSRRPKNPNFAASQTE